MPKVKMPAWKLSSPIIQNLFASIIVALGPGIYVALTILGAGGGQASAADEANIVNSVLYAIYFFVGLFSGSIVNTIGPKYTLMIGTIGYPIFVGGQWYYTDYGKFGYPIVGGVILGITAVLLWTAAGYIAFSYAAEKHKGLYISMQWALLSVGSTLASLVAFAINYHATVQHVPTAVYITFICLMASAFFIAFFFIVPPSKVRRSDGSALNIYPHKGFWTELKAQAELFKDWRMLVMIIPFFGSEIAIIVISTLNALYFNIRTRSLNSVMFNLMQAIGAMFITFTLDYERIGTRRTRGLVSIAAMGTIVVAGWIGLTVWLYRHPLDPLNPPLWDWTDSEFGGYFVLNLIFGLNMVIYQVTAQWITASLSNDPEKLARFAGFAKGGLAGGLAASFGVEAGGVGQLGVVAFNFTLQAVGLVCMTIVCWFSVLPTSKPEATSEEASTSTTPESGTAKGAHNEKREVGSDEEPRM